MIGLSTDRDGVIGASRNGHAQGNSHSEIPHILSERATGLHKSFFALYFSHVALPFTAVYDKVFLYSDLQFCYFILVI